MKSRRGDPPDGSKAGGECQQDACRASPIRRSRDGKSVFRRGPLSKILVIPDVTSSDWLQTGWPDRSGRRTAGFDRRSLSANLTARRRAALTSRGEKLPLWQSSHQGDHSPIMKIVSGRELATADDTTIGDRPLARTLSRDTRPMSDQAAASPWIIEATSENFQREVIERSLEVPVVIDFWAEWCAPCRQLGPVLEALAEDYGGQFVLAKVDTEREAALAAEFGVRSIPAVFAVRDGQAVDGFVGVQSEAAIRAWLDRLLPTPAERVAAEAQPAGGRPIPGPPRPSTTRRSRSTPTCSQAQIGLARIALARRPARGRPGADPRHGAPGRVPRARGRAAQGRDHPPAPGAAGRRQRRGRPRGPGRTPRRPRAQVPARRGPGRRRTVRRRPGDSASSWSNATAGPTSASTPARPWSRSSSSCRPIPSWSPNTSGSSRWR